MTESGSGSSRATGVKRADEHDFAALASFFQQVWDSSATSDGVRAAWTSEAEVNPVDPGIPPPAYVFLKDGDVIGYVSTIPARFLVGGCRRDGYWLKGLWVLPDHRGGPVGFHLARAAASELGPLGALAVAKPARRLFEAVGFRDVAQPPNYVWPLRPSRLFGRLDPSSVLDGGESWTSRLWRVAQRTRMAGPVGAAATLALRAGRRRVNQAEVQVTQGWAGFPPDEVDTLWRAMAKPEYCGLVRDAAYLEWRYGRRVPRGYRPIMVRGEGGKGEGGLRAVAVLRLPELQESGRFAGVRLAWLCDLIFDPDDPVSTKAAHAALQHAELVARECGGDLLALSFAGPGYDRIFSDRRYIRRSPSVHLLLKGFDEVERAMGDQGDGSQRAPCSWVVARGDGDSDGAS